MKSTFLNYMLSGERGLLLGAAPTGVGKTYVTCECIAQYAISETSDRKILFTTTERKNLPVDELQKAYRRLGQEQKFLEDVLVLESNYDCVKEKITQIQIPEEFQTDAYKMLYKEIKRIEHAERNGNTDIDYLNHLIGKVSEELEPKFRKEIIKKLKKDVPGDKKKRLAAIKHNQQYHWIGDLYPAVYTDERKIIMLSINKLLVKNSPIIEPSYDILNSNLLEEAIIFIDEFDATKETIINEIIERAIWSKEDYIVLFDQICKTLEKKQFSQELIQARNRADNSATKKEYTYRAICEEAAQIYETYKLSYSYKTAESGIDHRQNFLFNDGAFHTLLRNNKRYIRAELNEVIRRVEIYFENGKEYYSNIKMLHEQEKTIVIYSMIRGVNMFLYHFRCFVYKWAMKYQSLINENRESSDDQLQLEHAINTILTVFNLSNEKKTLLMGSISNLRLKEQASSEMVPDLSFYNNGFKLYEFLDDDSHNDTTLIRFAEVENTAEKLLVFLANRAKVIGISATATIETVIGNYDLNYLKEKLKDRFHVFSDEVKDKMREELKSIWKPYQEGKVSVEVKVIDFNTRYQCLEERCKNIFSDEDISDVFVHEIGKRCNKNEYYSLRYCNILSLLKEFVINKDIQSFLCMNMALPKRGYSPFDFMVFEDALKYLKECYLSGSSECSNISLEILGGRNYEEKKKEILQRLSNGEKIFIMSTYKTLGAGQNLQYRVQNPERYIKLGNGLDEDDLRYKYKDIDALFLGDITNLAVNTYDYESFEEKDMFMLFFQAEELYQNNEINYYELDWLIKLGFRTVAKIPLMSHYKSILRNARSIRAQATQMTTQATGRLGRTYLKNNKIYIYTTEQLVSLLEPSILNDIIVSPEMQALIQERKKWGIQEEKNITLINNEAERISTIGKNYLLRFISRVWSSEGIALWRELRRIVLTSPTANRVRYEQNRIINTFYICCGKPFNKYLFSEYGDFSDVIIDFNSDKMIFRESGRAKRRGLEEDVIIREVSEEAARLEELFRYPGLKEYFKEQGWATSFEPNEYMLSPVLFNNIYLGALGEVTGKFIIENELGIELSSIEDEERFEVFDYELSPDVYIDFKHWKYTSKESRKAEKEKIEYKLQKIGGKRVYIINILAEEGYQVSYQNDERIIEIPYLITKEGKVNIQALEALEREK